MLPSTTTIISLASTPSPLLPTVTRIIYHTHPHTFTVVRESWVCVRTALHGSRFDAGGHDLTVTRPTARPCRSTPPRAAQAALGAWNSPPTHLAALTAHDRPCVDTCWPLELPTRLRALQGRLVALPPSPPSPPSPPLSLRPLLPSRLPSRGPRRPRGLRAGRSPLAAAVSGRC